MEKHILKVFFRHNLHAENLAAIERGEARTIPPDAVTALPDERFPIYLHYPLDTRTERCSICLSETEVAVLDVSRETFDNLPSICVDSRS